MHVLRWLLMVSLIAGLLGSTPLRAVEVSLGVDAAKQSLADEDAFIFNVTAAGGTTDVTLKVFDEKGALVRVLGGRRVSAEKVEIPWNLRDEMKQFVKPGKYTIRMESGWGLALDTAFGKNGVLDGPPFVSPRDLAVDADGNLYVLDHGAAILHKFRADGTPANDLAGKNQIAAPAAPFWGSVAVGPDGRIYLAETFTTSHVIDVYDGKSGERIFYIGGFFGNDGEWKETKGGMAYPALVRLSGDSKLYMTSPGYTFTASYDPRKPQKTGGVWMTRKIPAGDSGATNGRDVVYIGSAYYTQRNTLLKVQDKGDTGETVAQTAQFFNAATGNMEPMNNIYGMACSSTGDLYVALRTLGKVVKFVDGGLRLDSIASLGSKGKDAAKLEFITPVAVACTPDGKGLYIAEDGEKVSEKDTTPGLARVAKYRVTYAAQKEIQVTVEP